MKALPQLLIIGAGGFGREVLAWARQSRQCGRDWAVRGFLDDNIASLTGMRTPAEVISSIADYQPKSEDVFVCAIGNPGAKRKCSELLLARGARFTQLIHSTALLGDNVELSDGVILCPFSVASANNRLGFGAVLNLHATADHDAVIGDWSQINCHCDLTAATTVGREVFLGSHVSLVPGVRIGDGAYVGAGSVVTRDIPAGALAYGVPARIKR